MPAHGSPYTRRVDMVVEGRLNPTRTTRRNII